MRLFLQISCERGTAQELSSYFSFYVPGYQFTPAFRAKYWNGKIYLFSLTNQTLYCGLTEYLEKFAEERKYVIKYDQDVLLHTNSLEEDQRLF